MGFELGSLCLITTVTTRLFHIVVTVLGNTLWACVRTWERVCICVLAPHQPPYPQQTITQPVTVHNHGDLRLDEFSFTSR